jgi:D-threo-aldose 1-dehydrogenase
VTRQPVLATQRRQVGATDLQITAVGYGSAVLGNRFRPMAEEHCRKLVDHAWNNGVRLFDTAPMYGHGLAENRLGTALRTHPRAEYVLSTKVGRLLRPMPEIQPDEMWCNIPPMGIAYDYSYDGAMRSIDDSLQRMLTDRIDIVFVHDCDRYGHGANQPTVFEEAMNGAARALFKLRDQGVIGAVGVGVNEADVCVAAADRGGFDSFLLAGRYTLLDHGSLDDLMPLAAAHGISVILGGVFNSGILASGVRAGAHHNYGPPHPDIKNRVRDLETICGHYEVPLAAVALQFCLAHPAVASVLIGASTIEQQTANFDATEIEIPTDLWADLRHHSVIRDDAPTPMP